LVKSSKPIQGGRKIAFDLPQQPFKRVSVASHRDPDLDPVTQLAGYALGGGIDLPVLFRLDILPLCEQVAALGLMHFQIALEAFHPVVQRAQFLDLLAQLNELRAVNLRFLEFAQEPFVGFLDCGPSRVPVRLRIRDRVFSLGKSLAELIAEHLQFAAKRCQYSLDFGKDIGVRSPSRALPETKAVSTGSPSARSL